MPLNLDKYTRENNINIDKKEAEKVVVNFWDICFKTCKWMVTGLIVLVILLGLFNGINALYLTIKPVNQTISYHYVPKFTMEWEQKEQKENDVTKRRITEIVKNLSMPPNCTEEILKRLSEIEPEDKENFVNNMEEYYRNAIDYNVKREKNYNPRVSRNDILNSWKYFGTYKYGIVPLYFDYYRKQKTEINIEQNLNKFKRNLNLYILGGCIILFILLLIIPILLKIEENTRS